MGAKLAEAAPVIAPEPVPAKKRKRASSTGGTSAAAVRAVAALVLP